MTSDPSVIIERHPLFYDGVNLINLVLNRRQNLLKMETRSGNSIISINILLTQFVRTNLRILGI